MKTDSALQSPLLPPAPPVLPENAKGAPPVAQVLVNDGNVKIEKVLSLDIDETGRTYVVAEGIQLTTTNRADRISLHAGADGQVHARINGKHYELPITRGDMDQTLVIKTRGGDDSISIDPAINVAVDIFASDGNDHIRAGGGITRVFAGKGNDVVCMGGGKGLAFGGDGDDLMFAGTGSAVISGGRGRDSMFAGQGPQTRTLYLSGDQDEDDLHGGDGKVILNGGSGNDKLVGYRRTTMYTGNGEDSVYSAHKADLIYAKNTDRIHNHSGAKVTEIRPSDAGKRGFQIVGAPDFIERIENKMEELRASPAGQKLLEEMDKLAEKIGSPVIIRTPYAVQYADAYWFDSKFVDTYDPEAEPEDDDHAPKYGFIKEGLAGAVATRAVVTIRSTDNEDALGLSPLISLFHEMIHAYSGATGTQIPGYQPLIDDDGTPLVFEGVPEREDIRELQTVGLPHSGEAFDFDNDPSTPPTTKNPYPFYENALREELGVPLRKRYTEL